MAKVNVKFNRRFRFMRGKIGIPIEPGKVIEMSEEELRAFNKDNYEIVSRKAKKGKKAKDIPAKDKDTSEITFEIE